MRYKLWLTFITCLAYCIDKELWKAIDYLKEQVRVIKQLHYVLAEYLEYYHHERIYQGINRIIEPTHGACHGEIVTIERLGGLLKSYHRKVA